jgi:UDP-glucose 4-epimerase
MNNKNILITGAGGLIGNHFSRYLLDKGYNVIGIDNFSGSYRDNIDERIYDNRQFHPIDLLNVETLNGIVEYYKPDVIFHFAAYAALGLSPFIRNFNYSNNILASVNIINACVNYNVRKLVFTSSMDVYGNQKPPFTEDMIPRPEDPYGIAKYAVEMDIKEAHNRFGLEYTIVRPHNVIGIYQNIWDKYRNVIGIWIRQIIDNEPITIYGDGSVERAFSDIKYYLLPFEKTITNFDGEIFNMGSDKVYKLIDVAKIILKVGENFGYEGNIVHLEARKEVKLAYSNHEKAKQTLNFQDDTDLENIITEMFSWVLSQPKREVKKMPYEINKNIYSFWK